MANLHFTYISSSKFATDGASRQRQSQKVIKPLLAAACYLKTGRKPKTSAPLDQRYENLRREMRDNPLVPELTCHFPWHQYQFLLNS
jgi:hypothetical protein